MNRMRVLVTDQPDHQALYKDLQETEVAAGKTSFANSIDLVTIFNILKKICVVPILISKP